MGNIEAVVVVNEINRLLVFICLLAIPSMSIAQPSDANYDESKVPVYVLPDPLLTLDGVRVTNAKQWPARRAEIIGLFETNVYGRSPAVPTTIAFKQTSVDRNAIFGKAVRKEITVSFVDQDNAPRMHVLLYLPVGATSKTPIFVGANFRGNHTVHADPGITLSDAWMPDEPEQGNVNHRATEKARGQHASRWQVEMILERGYGLATIYCGDIDPDFHDEFHNGVHGMLQKPEERDGSSWGSIAAWSWGLSRAMDYLETDDDVDHRRVAVIGHSRLGKTALWAGASDERFALVVSNNSGCGGAALHRRAFGETVKRINSSFPHWFCGNFKKYNDNEGECPVDQHMLVALIAPRPIYIASAEDDRWADPRGEFLSAKHAEPVYELLGTDGLGVDKMPAVNQPIGATMGYHIRAGKHDVTAYDWEQYLNFADRHFK